MSGKALLFHLIAFGYYSIIINYTAMDIIREAGLVVFVTITLCVILVHIMCNVEMVDDL